MSRKTKLILFWSIIIISLVLVLFGRSYIFTGKIVINSQPPYNVEVIGGKIINCTQEPCIIRVSSGVTDLYLSKPEHQNIFTRVDVGIWRKEIVEVVFKPFPKLLSAATLPQTKALPTYSLITDKTNGMQKLVTSESEEAIVYFSRGIKDPKIFGDKNFVLVIDGRDGQVYKIDVRASKRYGVNIGLADLTGGKWSIDGRYFVFREKDSEFLSLIDTAIDRVEKLDIDSELDQVAWVNGERLVFSSNQSFSSTVEAMISGKSLKFLGDQKGANYVFGFYNPVNHFYEEIGNFSEIVNPPISLTPTTNGSEIYFESGGKIYQVKTYLGGK